MYSKKLSIIIPYYTETPKEILPALASINGQVGIDFSKIECILVNDGNHNVFPETFLQLFEKCVPRCLYTEENKGPGMARQAGIDNARGEYVMFCDADDALHNVGVLSAFLETLETQAPDMLGSPWYEELFNTETGEYSYTIHEGDYTWMHGKAFQRAFLQEKNLRFHEKLRVHEDSYFLAIVAAETENIRKSDIISYVWKYRENSITRKNNAIYFLDSLPEHMEAMALGLEEIEARHPEKMSFMTTELIMLYYFMLKKQVWLLPENSGRLHRAEAAFRNRVKKFMKYYSTASPDLAAALYARQRAKWITIERETETLGEWLKRLELTD
jgi:glycosyltransferase involved in cell wall biosynthesis